jgi:hypothetical protein
MIENREQNRRMEEMIHNPFHIEELLKTCERFKVISRRYADEISSIEELRSIWGNAEKIN